MCYTAILYPFTLIKWDQRKLSQVLVTAGPSVISEILLKWF
jgi:hypothetical protein